MLGNMASRFDLHTQLGSLLENAQCLLADSAPSSTSGYGYYGAGPNTASGRHQPLHHGPNPPAVYSFVAMQAEIRTLEFWRSIIAECLATFFYVTLVLSVSTAASDLTYQTNQAVAAGLAAAALSACFGPVSGAHANPAVTCAMLLVRGISPLRAVLYVCAQCGGGIAGSALVLGVQGRINDLTEKTGGGTFGMEFVLTFLVVYAFCAAREPRVQIRLGYSKMPPITPGSWRLNPMIVGVAYAACLMAWKGSLNPARALGSAFVSTDPDRFKQHWVFWVGPILGAVTGALSHEFVFNPKRRHFGLSGFKTTPTTASTAMTGMSMHGGNPHQTGMMGNAVMGQTGMMGNSYNMGGGNMGNMGPMGGTTMGGGGHYGMHGGGTTAQGMGGMGGRGMMMGDHMDQMSVRSEDEMLDDLERAKQYKANIMQDFHDGSTSMYSGRPGYGKRGHMGEQLYSGTKSMYNQPMYDRYDSKSGYGPGGYDGGPYGTAVRRSRSINVGRGGGPNAGMTRRNPYDYLPDEPPPGPPGVGGPKPDIMQTSVDQSGGTRLTGAKGGPGSSPRYGADNYANEKISDAYGAPSDYAHRSKGLLSADDAYGRTTGPGGGPGGGYGRLGSSAGGPPPPRVGAAGASAAGAGGYNASYSQQTGSASISAAGGASSAAAAASNY